MNLASVKLLPTSPHFTMPCKGTTDSAGYDLFSVETGTLAPGKWALVKCGFKMELPAGFEAQIRPRSGLALRHGITVLNAPGTIDADYRGEVGVILINHSSIHYTINVGDRIAQMVISSPANVNLQTVNLLSASERGEGGY